MFRFGTLMCSVSTQNREPPNCKSFGSADLAGKQVRNNPCRVGYTNNGRITCDEDRLGRQSSGITLLKRATFAAVQCLESDPGWTDDARRQMRELIESAPIKVAGEEYRLRLVGLSETPNNDLMLAIAVGSIDERLQVQLSDDLRRDPLALDTALEVAQPVKSSTP